MLLSNLTARFAEDTRAQVAALFGLSLLPLLGLTGASVDYTNASAERTRLQAALDAAVLAGAAATTDQVGTAARTFSGVLGSSSVTPTFTVNGSTVTGSASTEVPAKFLRAFGKTSIPVGASAAAAASVTGTAAPSGGVCVLLLDPNASQALLLNSGANINAPDCEFHVKSTGNPAAMFNSGSTFNFKQVCVQGTNVTQNSITIPNLRVNCPTATDPFAGQLPTPSTSGNCASNNYNGGNITLAPGIYCNINFNSITNVTFQPGLYVIRGTWNVNGGTWSCPACTGGAGVTFYFADANSKFQFNSGVKATLTAPTTGTYAGLLFFEAPNLSKSDFIFNPSQGFDWTGLVYLPSRNVTFNSSSQISSGNITMVFNKLILNGTKWTFGEGPKKIASPSAPTPGPAERSVFLKF